MRSTGSTLTAGCLALAGAGFLTLSGAGIAQARPAAPPVACVEMSSTLTTFNATLKNNQAKFATDRAAYVATIHDFGDQVLKITSSVSPAAYSAGKTYITDLEAGVAANNLNQAKLTAEFDRMDVLVCTPKGAPKTGGGSSAGLQDPALLGAGGGAALAGLVVIGLTLRRRPRTSADVG